MAGYEMRMGRVGAVLVLALTLALAAAIVCGVDNTDGNKPVETLQQSWFIQPSLPGPAREEQLVTISPTAYAYPTDSLGQLAPVGPVLGRPVLAEQNSREPVVTAVGELLPVMSQHSTSEMTDDNRSTEDRALEKDLRRELEERREVADMMSLHQLAQQHTDDERASRQAIERINSKLSELQATENAEEGKISEDRGKISLLHAELSKAQAAEEAKEEEARKIANEEKIEKLQSELEEEQTQRTKARPAEKPREQEKKMTERDEAHAAASSTPVEAAESVSTMKQVESVPTAQGDALDKMVEDNKASIDSLKEELKRLKLVSQGQYAILYKRLDTLSAQLNQRSGDSAHDQSLVLQAQAAVRQGRSMVEHQARLQQLTRVPSQEAAASPPVVNFAEGFQPERLFSGYNLAGGDHPGQLLGRERQQWLQRAVTAGGVDSADPLVVKRRVIRSTLLKLAEGDAKPNANADVNDNGSRNGNGGYRDSSDRANARGGDAAVYASRDQARDTDAAAQQEHIHRSYDNRDDSRGESIMERHREESSGGGRAEEGFKKAEKRREEAAVHPEGMQGSVYRHFLKEMSKRGKRPMLFDVSDDHNHARASKKKEGAPQWDPMHLTSGYVGSGLDMSDESSR